MLTLEDCIPAKEETQAVAEPVHVPEIAAGELGNYLAVTPDDQRRIRSIIRADIAAAQARGDKRHTLRLKLVPRHLSDMHPDRRKCADRNAAITP